MASLGGFSGRETVFTAPRLAQLVASGEARYFLLGGSTGFGFRGATNAGAAAVESACTSLSGGLYDCAGKAAAIADAS